ncbi:MAG: polysaccharide biosynthesis tyrosine autokinase [Planctomycetota bacterium]
MTANPLSTIPPIGPATGMTPPPPTSKFKPIDPVKLARQHLMLLVVVGVIGLMVGAGLYVFLRRTAPQFTSQAQLVFEPRAVSNPFDTTVGGGAMGGNNDSISRYMNNEANLIMSDEIVRLTLQRTRVLDTRWYAGFGGDADRARAHMQQEMLRISPMRGTTLINLSMTAPNPGDAQLLLDELMQQYLTIKRLNNDQAGSSLRRLFLTENNRFEDDIQRVRNEQRRFIEDNEIETLGVAASEEQVVHTKLLSQQLELTSFLSAAQGSYESLRRSTDAQAMTDEENAYLQQLPPIARREEELRSLDESRRQLLASGKGEAHPQIVQLDHRRDAVEFELNREIDQELGEYRALQLQTAARQVEGLMGQLAALEPQLAATKTRLQELTQKLAEYAQLEVDLQILQEKKQRADAALDTLRAMSERDDYVRVKTQVSPSQPEMTSPTLVIVPGITFLLVGLVGGLVVLREMLDQRVRSPQDLKLLPIETGLLGLIPHASEDPTGTGEARRAVEQAPTGLLTESYRQVRTAVLSKMDRRGYKTLLCVAAQPGAGTSTVIQNLAASLAFNGRDVLIVDANFRRPLQHELMGCDNRRGLVDVLKGRAQPDDVVVAHRDMSLSLLPTGQAADAPPELLEGSAFRGLLGELETRYDVVLIDTPPALLTSDSQMLSKHVDAIAVVVNAGSDQRGMLGRMLNQLDGQRADVLGVILNGVKSAAGGYFRQSYEQFYQYREAGDRSEKNAGRKGRRAAKNGRNGDGNGHPPTPPSDRRLDLEDAPVAAGDEDLDLGFDLDDDDTLDPKA